MHCIHVSADGSGAEVLDEVAPALPGAQVVTHVVHARSVHQALVDKTREVGAQLLVLGLHGRNARRDFLFGTATERVMLSGELSVMVTP